MMTVYYIIPVIYYTAYVSVLRLKESWIKNITIDDNEGNRSNDSLENMLK